MKLLIKIGGVIFFILFMFGFVLGIRFLVRFGTGYYPRQLLNVYYIVFGVVILSLVFVVIMTIIEFLNSIFKMLTRKKTKE